jgi:hypothetical protein
MMPAKGWTFFTTFALNLIALMIVWLVRTGVQEHAQHNEQ